MKPLFKTVALRALGAAISLMVPLGLVEVARTGVAGITRGPEGMKD